MAPAAVRQLLLRRVRLALLAVRRRPLELLPTTRLQEAGLPVRHLATAQVVGAPHLGPAPSAGAAAAGRQTVPVGEAGAGVVDGLLPSPDLAGAGAPRDGAVVGAASDVVLLDEPRGALPDGEGPVVGPEGQANAELDVVQERKAAEPEPETEPAEPKALPLLVPEAPAVPTTRPNGAVRQPPGRPLRGATETFPKAKTTGLALPPLKVAAPS